MQVKMKRSEELRKDEVAMENLQEAIQREKYVYQILNQPAVSHP